MSPSLIRKPRRIYGCVYFTVHCAFIHNLSEIELYRNIQCMKYSPALYYIFSGESCDNSIFMIDYSAKLIISTCIDESIETSPTCSSICTQLCTR
ncbi:hypothetical protein PUN28_002034 [Cardiocondyla obscurior]|uniref:Uncharacterized protein n=1 Tax=Cardiocondyla obscurior TaxID=286306 RepID=A0AAW2GSD7_9HYME